MEYLQRLTAIGRHPFLVLGCVFVAAIVVAARRLDWSDLWATPDQRGRRLFERQHFEQAADAFLDARWRGVALMRAGNFKEAAQVFGGVDTVEAAYDQGNALVLLGKYDEAVCCYDRALALRRGWTDAEANRTLARLRAERVKTTGGDQGDQSKKADEIVYDKNKKRGGEETENSGRAHG